MTAFDPTAGDNVDGDDLEVRRAAVDALGPYNGTVVVVDPQTGRVLTIVNQKTALESGFTPCSTIKLVTAFAALNEGLIDRDTPVHLARRISLDLSAPPWRIPIIPISRCSATAWATSAWCIMRACSGWAKRPDGRSPVSTPAAARGPARSMAVSA